MKRSEGGEKMELLDVKGETDAPIYVQQPRGSWDRRPVLRGSAKTEASRVRFVISESSKVTYGSIWTWQQASCH